MRQRLFYENYAGENGVQLHKLPGGFLDAGSKAGRVVTVFVRMTLCQN